MDTYVIWTTLDGLTRLLIASVELLCALALLVRFRSQIVRALPAALGFAWFAFVDTLQVGFQLAEVWQYDWATAVNTGLGGCSAVAAFGVVVGLGLTGAATRGVAAKAPAQASPEAAASPPVAAAPAPAASPPVAAAPVAAAPVAPAPAHVPPAVAEADPEEVPTAMAPGSPGFPNPLRPPPIDEDDEEAPTTIQDPEGGER